MTTNLQNARVGVLIPTHNRLEYLKEALDCARKQSHENLSIVVIDNASSDGTGDFMSLERDARVRYIANDTNLGMAGSIDKGIGAMPSDIEWCTVLCDDDMLAPGFVAAMLHAVAAHSPRTILNGHRIFIDGSGARIGEALPSPMEETAEEFLRNRLNSKRMTYLTGVFFHRKAFEEIGGYPKFRTGLASDDALIFSLGAKDRIVHAPEALSCIRMHSGAESRSSIGIEDVVATMSEFRSYCSRHAPGFPATRAEELDKLLLDYSRLINSAMFLRALHSRTGSRSAEERGDIASLCSQVGRISAEFSLRARITAAAVLRLGICPERFQAYRLLWFLAGSSRRARWRLHILQQAASRTDVP